MTEYVELYIDRGADFETSITLQDDFTGQYQNIAGYNVVATLKRSVLSQNATANLTCTLSNPNEGEFTMTMTAANTALLPMDKYFLYVYTSAQNKTERLVEGVIFVT